MDQTITELSGTLAQLSTLVAHINGQISGITGRVNLTLDNFDQAVANLAKDAGSVTYQVGNTVSQVAIHLLSVTIIESSGAEQLGLLPSLHHPHSRIPPLISSSTPEPHHKSTRHLLNYEKFG